MRRPRSTARDREKRAADGDRRRVEDRSGGQRHGRAGSEHSHPSLPTPPLRRSSWTRLRSLGHDGRCRSRREPPADGTRTRQRRPEISNEHPGPQSFGVKKPIVADASSARSAGTSSHDVDGGPEAILAPVARDLDALQEAGVDRRASFCNEKDYPYQVKVGVEIAAAMAATGRPTARAHPRPPSSASTLLWDPHCQPGGRPGQPALRFHPRGC